MWLAVMVFVILVVIFLLAIFEPKVSSITGSGMDTGLETAYNTFVR